ncbi:MAG: NAD(P)-dependent oxidoreductase [Candidatus Marinimicrobia bacterium]|nr:NAD(P)-dependent oxidoreductase [Candidatus Neomarinimicrobiota bacterium]
MDLEKVLVTGCAGYIGSVLMRLLLNKGYKVKGIDNLQFGGESLLGIYNNPNFEFLYGDIRDNQILDKVLKNVDHVVHLAAIVGDPACATEPDKAREVNWKASNNLFKMAKESDVDRFVFASTCSNYGKMDAGENNFVSEESPLRPVSLYAELKVKFEKYILASEKSDDLTPVSLRFATVYGLSSRPRFDLTVNDFTRQLQSGRELVIYGEQFWRPYCHVFDISRAILMTLQADKKIVAHQVFGVGSTAENYQKKMIVDELLEYFPAAKIKYVKKEEDPRDYRVDFSHIKNELGFKVTHTVPDGIREVKEVLDQGLISEPFSKKYRNV